jgi:hypothetical protein
MERNTVMASQRRLSMVSWTDIRYRRGARVATVTRRVKANGEIFFLFEEEIVKQGVTMVKLMRDIGVTIAVIMTCHMCLLVLF